MLTNQYTSTGLLMEMNTYVGTIKEDYCIICFYLYSSEPVSLGSFVSKRLNLYFLTVIIKITFLLFVKH